MWEGLEHPWRHCLQLCWEAFRAGSVPVGAVVVNSYDGRTVASGRNRMAEETGPPGQISGSSLAHAEVNALLGLGAGRVDPRQCMIYSALEPCPQCMGAIYMSGIRTVAYACRDSFAGAADIIGVTPYLSRKPIKLIGPEDPALEDLVMALQVSDLLGRNHRSRDALLKAWSSTVPGGVALGLSAHGELLDGLKSTGADAQSAVCALWELWRGMFGD